MQLKNRLKHIYFKLVKAEDTPHHIALGFAIGIFYGLFPFVGIIFALITAAILKGNKIAAVIGCFVTNTWMSVILAMPSVRLGAKIFGLDWRIVWSDALRYLKVSNIFELFKIASGDVIIPALVGFLIIALFIAIMSYAIALYVILKHRGK